MIVSELIEKLKKVDSFVLIYGLYVFTAPIVCQFIYIVSEAMGDAFLVSFLLLGLFLTIIGYLKIIAWLIK